MRAFRESVRRLWFGRGEYMLDFMDGLERALDRVARGEPFRYVTAHKKHIREHNGRFLMRGAECGEYCHCDTCILGYTK